MLHSRHPEDAEVDGEVEKEDTTEGEAKEEKMKEESNKGCASMPYILYGKLYV